MYVDTALDSLWSILELFSLSEPTYRVVQCCGKQTNTMALTGISLNNH